MHESLCLSLHQSSFFVLVTYKRSHDARYLLLSCWRLTVPSSGPLSHFIPRQSSRGRSLGVERRGTDSLGESWLLRGCDLHNWSGEQRERQHRPAALSMKTPGWQETTHRSSGTQQHNSSSSTGLKRVCLDLTFPDTRNPDESWFENRHKDEICP